MLKLLGSVERVVILALLIAIAALTYSASSIKAELKTAKQTIEQKDLAIENAVIQAEYLTQSVKLSEQANAKLMKERESLAKINAQHSAEIAKLNKQFHFAQTQIAKLRSSNDKAVKDWANSAIPCDAISLLKYASNKSCDENSSANAVQVRDTALKLNPAVRSGIKF